MPPGFGGEEKECGKTSLDLLAKLPSDFQGLGTFKKSSPLVEAPGEAFWFTQFNTTASLNGLSYDLYHCRSITVKLLTVMHCQIVILLAAAAAAAAESKSCLWFT